MVAADQDRLVTRAQAAEFLGLAPQTLAVWAMTNKFLPIVRIGSNVRYRMSDIARIVAEGKNPTPRQASPSAGRPKKQKQAPRRKAAAKR